jgi:hypothetical protein
MTSERHRDVSVVLYGCGPTISEEERPAIHLNLSSHLELINDKLDPNADMSRYIPISRFSCPVELETNLEGGVGERLQDVLNMASLQTRPLLMTFL